MMPFARNRFIGKTLLLLLSLLCWQGQLLAQAPEAPAGLNATQIGAKTFTLNWTAAFGATTYVVYKDGVAYGNPTPNLKLAIKGLNFGSSYVMTVKARDAAGNLSAASEELVVTTFGAIQINTAATAPVIDGVVDAVWANAPVNAVANITTGTITSDADCSGSFRMLWDNSNLYFIAEVRDDILKQNSSVEPYLNDAIELFLDLGYNAPASGEYQADDFQYDMTFSGSPLKEYKNGSLSGLVCKTTTTAGGYIVEASISWAAMGITDPGGAANAMMGLDVNIVDVDVSTNGFDGKRGWYNTQDLAYTNATLLAPGKLFLFTTLDTEAPTAPAGLAASNAAENSFVIEWTAATDNIGVTAYEVYKDGVLAGTTPLTALKISGLVCATSYNITVKAKDAAGNSSAASTVLTATSGACPGPDAEAPTAPANVTAQSITTTSANITWTAATDNRGVAGYEVLVNGTPASATTGTSRNISGLSCGTSYVITVRATDAAGNSSTSAPLNLSTLVCPDTLAPTMPTGLTATAITATGFTLNWTAATDNIGVQRYAVFKNGVRIDTTSATTINLPVTCESSNRFVVFATDSSGNNSMPSAELLVTGATCALTYEAEDATRTGGAVANAVAGYSGTGYWRNEATAGNTVLFSVTANRGGAVVLTTRYVAGTAAAASLYVNGTRVRQTTFAQRAAWGNQTQNITLNAGANSIEYRFENGDNGDIAFDYIRFNNGAPDTEAPLAPTGLQASGNTATSFQLAWQPATDNVGVVSYEVLLNGVPAGSTATTTFTLNGLSCGVYKTTVRAKDAAGNNSQRSTVLETITVPCANANEIYVDSAATAAVQDGSFGNPFKTIQQAADIAVAGKTVMIRKGTYREEVQMKTDGVTYQSYPGERALVTGTEQLLQWEDAGSNVYKTKMPFHNEIADQLFVDRKMIYAARWPDQTSADLIDPTDGTAEDVTIDGNHFIIHDVQFNEPAARWLGADIWVNLARNGNDGQGWTGKVIAVSGNNITVDFREPPRPGEQPWSVGPKTQYYLFNPLPEAVAATGGIPALLSAGEWYLQDSMLYLRMPNNGVPNATGAGAGIVEAKKRTLAFHSSDPATNRNSYTIRNIDLFACTIVTDENYRSQPRTYPEDAYNILLEGIHAKYISHFTDHNGDWQTQWAGNTGIILSGVNNIMRNCILQYAAGPAVCMNGFGSKLLNNTVLEANYTCTNSGAVNSEFKSVNNEIAYNRVHNTTQNAIRIQGFVNGNPAYRGVARVHHNTCTQFMLRSGDSGGIDEVATDGQWVRIDHNILINTNTNDLHASRFGLYHDFGGGPNLLTGRYIDDHNIIAGVRPVIINHVRQINIFNNILLNNDPDWPQGVINGAGDTGIEDSICNNIMSEAPYIIPSLADAIITNNITDAKGAVLNELFLDAANNDFRLKPTAARAIDKGISFGAFNDPVFGSAVDIGAFELGSPAWQAIAPDLYPPLIYPNGGSFSDSVLVRINADTTSGAVTVHYTTDGTEPTAASPVYSGPFYADSSGIVKAIAIAADGSLVSEPAQAVFDIISTANVSLREPENPRFTAPGVIAGYYEWSPVLNYQTLPDFSTLSANRTDTAALMDLSLPHRPDNFMFQFKGFIDVPVNGLYEFFTTSDDNSKLYIGDIPVVDNDFLQAPTERSGKIGLKAGKHAITVQYLESGGGETLSVSFKAPNAVKIRVPAGRLFYQLFPKPVVTIAPNNSNVNTSDVTVTITADLPDSRIYYTTDGSTPTASSALYSGPFVVSQSSVVKAMAIATEGTEGDVARANFIISKQVIGSGFVSSSLYPNPARGGAFTLRLKNPMAGQVVQLLIFDAGGKTVYRKDITINTLTDQQLEHFSLPFLRPAAYVVSLKTISTQAGSRFNDEHILIVK